MRNYVFNMMTMMDSFHLQRGSIIDYCNYVQITYKIDLETSGKIGKLKYKIRDLSNNSVLCQNYKGTKQQRTPFVIDFFK